MQGSSGEDSPPRTESIVEQVVHGQQKPKSPVEKPEEFINRKARRHKTTMKNANSSIESSTTKVTKHPKPTQKLSESLMVDDSSNGADYHRKHRNGNDSLATRQTMEDFGSFDKTTNDASPSMSSPSKKHVSKKRDRDQDDSDDVDPTPQELAQMSRSERKKFREKKRRSEVNKGFDDLMALLLEIDPEVRSEAEERARRGQWKGALGAHEENLLNRVDLIGRTVKVLSRLHRENEQRKMFIDELTRGGNAAAAASARNNAANEQASMMMPMMSTSDSGARMPNRRPHSLQDSSGYMPSLLAQASLASSAQLGFPPGEFLGFGGPQGVPGLSSALASASNNSNLGGATGLSAALGGTSRLVAALSGGSSSMQEYLRLLQQHHAQQSGSAAPSSGRGAMGQRFQEGRGL